MTIAHDAYLFDPAAFANLIAVHLDDIVERQSFGYSNLRKAAIRSLHDNERVQYFVDRYGGWNESAILQELPQQWSGDTDDLSFWATLLLYSEMHMDQPLGLKSHWKDLNAILTRQSWTMSDRELLVRGADWGKFSNVLPGRLADSDFVQRTVTGIGPSSVGGHAGWLDTERLLLLKERMSALRSLRQSAAIDHGESEALLQAEVMIETAIMARLGLCVILSG